MEESKEENADLEYYTMPNISGPTRHLFLPPRKMELICNVLYDYESLIGDCMADPPEGAKDNRRWEIYMDYHRNLLKEIREEIETSMGYSTEEHWRKCRKKRGKEEEDDGVGEDAMIQLARKRAERKRHEPETKREGHNQPEGDGQLNMFGIWEDA